MFIISCHCWLLPLFCFLSVYTGLYNFTCGQFVQNGMNNLSEPNNKKNTYNCVNKTVFRSRKQDICCTLPIISVKGKFVTSCDLEDREVCWETSVANSILVDTSLTLRHAVVTKTKEWLILLLMVASQKLLKTDSVMCNAMCK